MSGWLREARWIRWDRGASGWDGGRVDVQSACCGCDGVWSLGVDLQRKPTRNGVVCDQDQEQESVALDQLRLIVVLPEDREDMLGRRHPVTGARRDRCLRCDLISFGERLTDLMQGHWATMSAPLGTLKLWLRACDENFDWQCAAAFAVVLGWSSESGFFGSPWWSSGEV